MLLRIFGNKHPLEVPPDQVEKHKCKDHPDTVEETRWGKDGKPHKYQRVVCAVCGLPLSKEIEVYE